ncbi:MAG: hypothetical protein L0Z70_03165 [Chloroflexi bacterium]|nr:hypothetical protein [Chloroflexota bacterium]
MRQINFSWRYALIIAGIAVLFLMVMDFNRRVAGLRRLTEQKGEVAAQLAGMQQTEAYLSTQVVYATSEAAVVEWAYQSGKMVRPGDAPIVPIAPSDATPMPLPTPAVVNARVSNWQVWLWLFFDPPADKQGRPPATRRAESAAATPTVQITPASATTVP